MIGALMAQGKKEEAEEIVSGFVKNGFLASIIIADA